MWPDAVVHRAFSGSWPLCSCALPCIRLAPYRKNTQKNCQSFGSSEGPKLHSCAARQLAAFEISDLRSKLLSVNLIWEIDVPWATTHLPPRLLGNLLKVAPWLQIEEMTQIIVASNHHSSKPVALHKEYKECPSKTKLTPSMRE